MELKALTKKLPYKWKIQSFNKDKTKASCVAYIDSRDAQNLLDDVCWPENWQVKFHCAKDKLFAEVWIKIWSEWIWKSDSGSFDNAGVEESTASKWETSDAFKRACVMWWIGRFLYDNEIVWVAVDEYKKPVNKNGEKIQDLSEYCTKYNDWMKNNKK